MSIDTDYLVVGAGASGLAFADTLLAEAPNITVTLVDRREAPGGHCAPAEASRRIDEMSRLKPRRI